MKSIYVVHKGKRPGVYYSAEDYMKQIKGYSNPQAKAFKNLKQAVGYMSDMDWKNELAQLDRKASEKAINSFTTFYVVPGINHDIFYTQAAARLKASNNLIAHTEIKAFSDINAAKKYLSSCMMGKFIDAPDILDTAISLSKTDISALQKNTGGWSSAFVDGSFHPKNKMCTCGVVFIHNKSIECFSFKPDDPDIKQLRNIGSEIFAAEKAISIAQERGVKRLRIYYDCEAIAQCCYGSKLKKEAMKRFADIYKEAVKDMQIKLVKVKGHSGIYLHNMADRLASSVIS